mmetsp:Transcript_9207/g.10635  ORF Transcript_9207/g.10635 Transcript_9207/m.10635 type:complete len:454 (-) Transcript_9207:343-1704(-)|eukprot:CAMPEP_0197855642 /NCGR_PEP_ID=MMETSP1438-20131217/27006_1 /TAXON_ID=1461541 /ORGANISM="Pterosperma sp., Strain CCMP1384" /LENGTH=453 /DNA_ID=CAMNT_0043470831 /DNA_START=166 /DNA_END=1530 /DNA_ORIENTATION=-
MKGSSRVGELALLLFLCLCVGLGEGARLTENDLLRVYHPSGYLSFVFDQGNMSLAETDFVLSYGHPIRSVNITSSVYAMGSVRAHTEDSVLISAQDSSFDNVQVYEASPESSSLLTPLVSFDLMRTMLQVCQNVSRSSGLLPCENLSTFFPYRGATGAAAFAFRGWDELGVAVGSQSIVVESADTKSVRILGYNGTFDAACEIEDHCPRFVPGSNDRLLVFVRGYPVSDIMYAADLTTGEEWMLKDSEGRPLPNVTTISGCPQFVDEPTSTSTSSSFIYVGDTGTEDDPVSGLVQVNLQLSDVAADVASADVATLGVEVSYRINWPIPRVDVPNWADVLKWSMCEPLHVQGGVDMSEDNDKAASWQMTCRSADDKVGLLDGVSGHVVKNFTVPHTFNWCITDDCYHARIIRGGNNEQRLQADDDGPLEGERGPQHLMLEVEGEGAREVKRVVS